MEASEIYSYRVTFTVEILVNREQEYYRRKKDKEPDDDYSEFDEYDFVDAKRWIRDTETSFYAKDVEEIKNRIAFTFHNARINTIPLVEGGYFYWFDNNCLVKQERLLHRGMLIIDYACDVEITEEDLKLIANKKD